MHFEELRTAVLRDYLRRERHLVPYAHQLLPTAAAAAAVPVASLQQSMYMVYFVLGHCCVSLSLIDSHLNEEGTPL